MSKQVEKKQYYSRIWLVFFGDQAYSKACQKWDSISNKAVISLFRKIIILGWQTKNY